MLDLNGIEHLIHNIMNTKEGVEELFIIAENLARSLGHDTTCLYVTQGIKCTCGQGKDQATALDAYEYFKNRLIDDIQNKIGSRDKDTI